MPLSPLQCRERSRSQKTKNYFANPSSLVPLRPLQTSSFSSTLECTSSNKHYKNIATTTTDTTKTTVFSNYSTPAPTLSKSSTSQEIDIEIHRIQKEEENLDLERCREIQICLDGRCIDEDSYPELRNQRSDLRLDFDDSDTGQGVFHRGDSSHLSQRSHSALSTSRVPLLPRQLILSPSAPPLTPTGSASHDMAGSYTGKNGATGSIRNMISWKLVLSYMLDWAVLAAFAALAILLGDIAPIKRPFSLTNETISFPFTVNETVPVEYLYATNGAVPLVLVAVIALVFVPGPTVPRGTPRRMIWQRRLWELHTGLLGLALAQCAAMFVTNGLKNMFGKPRPDLLSRCQPDMANVDQFKIGMGLLVTHLICTQTDTKMLDDGFRSWPSGHSSSSAAGLIYLSLFIASKFTITIPFVTPWWTGEHMTANRDAAVSAFPSRVSSTGLNIGQNRSFGHHCNQHNEFGLDANARVSSHSRVILSLRRQAAAPPLYLFSICLLPLFGAVFIASSRWFDYRHHAFDIFSGFLIGFLAAILGFRYYHMPIAKGAGWAWGPRSVDKAFWAGLGSYSFATAKKEWYIRPGDEEEDLEAGDSSKQSNTAFPSNTRGGNASESGTMRSLMPTKLIDTGLTPGSMHGNSD